MMHPSFHLDNDQRTYFTTGNASKKVQNPHKTTLLGFFKLCKNDSFARGLLYSEVSVYFIWKKEKVSLVIQESSKVMRLVESILLHATFTS